jgi:hypothetical protein
MKPPLRVGVSFILHYMAVLKTNSPLRLALHEILVNMDVARVASVKERAIGCSALEVSIRL